MFRTKHITFTVPIEKEVTRIDKNGEKITKNISLLTVQDLWQADNQIFSTIFLKEFIELNVNTDMMTKNVKPVELNLRIVAVFLNTQILKMI